jgi:hypothetical protein
MLLPQIINVDYRDTLALKISKFQKKFVTSSESKQKNLTTDLMDLIMLFSWIISLYKKSVTVYAKGTWFY